MGCFLDNLRAFGNNADQWTTADQEEGEWRRTAEQGAERFMAKLIAAEKARPGLWCAVICPSVTGRAKERIAQSKRARAGSLAIVDQPQVARTCILRADVVLSFSGVTFVLFCLVFVFLISLKPRSFVESFFVLRYACAPTATRSYLTTVCGLFLFLFLPIFVSLEISFIPGVFVPLPFSRCMKSTSYVSPSRSYLTTVCVLFLFLFLPIFVSLVISFFPGVFVPLPFSRCTESTTYVSPSFRMVFLHQLI